MALTAAWNLATPEIRATMATHFAEIPNKPLGTWDTLSSELTIALLMLPYAEHLLTALNAPKFNN